MDILTGAIRWLLRLLKRLSLSKTKEVSFQFEVERKYRLSEKEMSDLPERLLAAGFGRATEVEITDTFIPAEVESDMIRIRDIVDRDGKSTVLTMKTWVEVEGGREREERESEPFDELTRSCFLALGRRLAGCDLLSFFKRRTEYRRREGRLLVTVALDQVEGLGEFSGPYLEVEVIANRQEIVVEARSLIEAVVRELLADASREAAPSYMEMLRLFSKA
ncbi:MAG: CYTH domain-containing protein [Candidatus Obscuribacterales bacterium]|nr:CYTH domain-containing protein [Candidatus Obscuribacterales bacterium]